MTDSIFKDYFSSASESYRKYRPVYPVQLFDYLATLSRENNIAWDCATGSGQAAIALAKHFNHVIATDASEQQIKNTIPAANIDYRIASAEQSALENNSVDLITVAQALHWFNLNSFFSETRRILKTDGLLAVWSYNLFQIEANIDRTIERLYSNTLSGFWPAERKMVENAYQDIEFPFEVEHNTSFKMTSIWNFDQLIGYLNTWSAVKAYTHEKKLNPVLEFTDELLSMWGSRHDKKQIIWPLTVIIGRA